MAEELLECASKECLCSFIDWALGEMTSKDPRLAEEMEEKLYVMINGMHFNPWSYKKAISSFSSVRWNMDDIREVMRDEGIASPKFNEYDFAYVMNMLYDDCSETIGDDSSRYAKMALGFLDGRNAREGKAWLYWSRIAKE